MCSPGAKNVTYIYIEMYIFKCGPSNVWHSQLDFFDALWRVEHQCGDVLLLLLRPNTTLRECVVFKYEIVKMLSKTIQKS